LQETGSGPVYPSERVTVIATPEVLVIHYKWLTNNKWIAVAFVWLVVQAQILLVFIGAEGRQNFSVMHHPGLLILSLCVTYWAMIPIFNRTTTMVTDRVFSVRRGPIPCPWPGNHARDIRDVQQICYARQRTIIVDGNVLYYIYAKFTDGRQSSLFTICNDECLALGLANQVAGWIRTRRQDGQRTLSQSNALPVVETNWFPPDRIQRLKICFCVLIVLLAAIASVWVTEYLALSYR
jgi:hypothetical protein